MEEQTPDMIELGIAPEKVFFIIQEARQFDAKVPTDEPGSASAPNDDSETGVLEDVPKTDATEEWLKGTIAGLDEEEQVNLVALTWLGRSDEFSVDDWDEVLKEAQDAHNEHTAEYLMGIPLLPDYLEEGLSKLDYAIEDYEVNRP